MLTIRKAITPSDVAACFQLRVDVFCKEQAVPEENERDE